MRVGQIMSLRLGGILDMSTVDWYGNVSLVVFFAGCNFRCQYCQNSSLIPLASGEEVGLGHLGQRIAVGRSLLDAVVFTGGEPLVQPHGLLEAARLAKESGLRLMLNTNGSQPAVVEQLMSEGLVDRIALDVKAPLEADSYERVIDLPGSGEAMVASVERTLDLSNSFGVEVEVRTTVAPTVSDEPEFIRKIASRIRGRCDEYHLQQFDNMGEVLSPCLRALPSPSRETMANLAAIAVGEGVTSVFIKTREFGLERIG